MKDSVAKTKGNITGAAAPYTARSHPYFISAVRTRPDLRETTGTLEEEARAKTAERATDTEESLSVNAAQTSMALDNARLVAEREQSDRRFREMVDALPAAIDTTDAEGRLTHFNPAGVEFSWRVPESRLGEAAGSAGSGSNRTRRFSTSGHPSQCLIIK
jgi:PAS domain-containing protein